jgi:hypothetical protein
VTVYVPAAVPPVVGGLELLPPQATCIPISDTSPIRSALSKIRFLRGFSPASPIPRKVIPPSGKKAANRISPVRRSEVVGTGRAVVEIVSVELTGLLLLIVTGVVEKSQRAPVVGNPAEQESEMLFV